MFRFLHAADIHLDSPLRGLERHPDAPVDRIRGATRRALERLVDLAVAERVAFVAIAGDLYDGDWPCYHTGIFLRDQMARLRDAGIPAVIIRGNHDAQNKITRDLTLPDNVRVLSHDRPETHLLPDWSVAVHGQGFASAKVTTDLSQAYPAREPGWFNLGMLHTCAEGRDGHERYAPCSIDGLRSKGYHYWALGHIHRREVLRAADPVVVFPGNVQGRHARETGPKGCTIVTVDDRLEVAGLEERTLDVVRWELCAVDAAGALDGEELLARFADRLDALLDAADDRLLAVRIQITGACPAHAKVAAQPERWAHEFRSVTRDRSDGRAWIEAVKLATRTSDDLDAALAPDGPLGELAGMVDAARDDDARIAELAGELDALRGKLPAELIEGFDGHGLVRDALDAVLPMLLERLGAGGGRR